MASSPKSPFGSSSPFNPETNPFLASAREADGPTGYAMIPSGPALDASEVESSELATEVLVRWEDTILHVGHLGAGKSFSVGESDCDLTIPAERLGSDRLPIVVCEGSSSIAIIPAGADATIEIGSKKLDLAAATAEGLASASVHATGASAVKLTQGMRISMRASGFVFEVASVFAGKRVAGKTSGDKKSFAAQALSFGVHGAILAAMFAFMPALAATDDAELSEDQAHLLSAALKAQAEKDLKEEEQKAKEDGEKSTQGSDTGMASPGEPGKMGNVKAPQANRHYAVAGNEKERALSRQAALEDAQNFGFAGMLASLQQDDPNAPTNPWSNGSIGMDAMTANGNLWGALPGESFGYGGLALSGGGEGAGGLGHGVGMGNLDTSGHGLGTCNSITGCSGFGTAHLGKRHETGTPKLRVTDSTVSGRIPPEVIQRVVRQNFGRFRACYENGLRTNPNLQGRVAVAFVVGRDGSVGSAQSAGSDLPDAGVVSCVVKQFYGLSFPAPEAGVVRVSYPIMFSN